MYAIRKIKLTIESKLEDIAPLGVAVRAICNLINISEEELNQIELCVVEVANNAVLHAHSDDKNNDIKLDLMIDPVQIKISMEYSGIPMKKYKVPELEFDPNDIHTLPEGGMGLFILQKSMDQVTYEVIAGKNVISMIKRIKHPPASS